MHSFLLSEIGPRFSAQFLGATKTEARKTVINVVASILGAAVLKHLRSAQHRALIATIIQARKAAGLTQRQLANKLKRSNSFVWKIEAGERRVDLLEFIEIARCLDQDPLQMFSRLLR